LTENGTGDFSGSGFRLENGIGDFSGSGFRLENGAGDFSGSIISKINLLKLL
jgi:hypothetical protein